MPVMEVIEVSPRSVEITPSIEGYSHLLFGHARLSSGEGRLLRRELKSSTESWLPPSLVYNLSPIEETTPQNIVTNFLPVRDAGPIWASAGRCSVTNSLCSAS